MTSQRSPDQRDQELDRVLADFHRTAHAVLASELDVERGWRDAMTAAWAGKKNQTSTASPRRARAWWYRAVLPVAVAAGIAAALFGTKPNPQAPPTELFEHLQETTRSVTCGQYAGQATSRQDRALWALAIHDNSAMIYITIGDRDHWVRGSITDSSVRIWDLSTRTAVFWDAESASGTFQFNGRIWNATAERVDPPAGLYRSSVTVRDGTVAGAWVLLPDGRQLGTISRAGHKSVAPPLTSGRHVTVDGARVVRMGMC